MDLDAQLVRLPKAELHQHIDGAVLPETAVELAAAAGIELDLSGARRQMIAPAHCDDQAALLRFFELPVALLQTASALQRVTRELVIGLARDGVRYAELRWAPRLHLEGGLSVPQVIRAVFAGLEDATRDLGAAMPLIGLIVTAMRSHPPAANVELARTSAGFGPPLIGFDLAGPEATYPAPPHAAAFRAAAEGGLALTVHAGEVPGAEHIVEALDLGARRIGHGVTAGDDPAVLELVRERDVTLDLCPTSNVQAGIVPELSRHPLARLHRQGISVTISTDDRTVSDTTLSAEMARVARALQLSPAELAAIALNAFRRGFSSSAALAPVTRAAEDAWAAWLARTSALS